MSAALTAPCKQVISLPSFSLPSKPHALPHTAASCQKGCLFLLPFMYRQRISLLLILIKCNLGAPCFVHTRSAFCRQGNWVNSSAKPSQQQEHGSYSKSLLAGHKSFFKLEAKSTSETLTMTKNSPGDPTAVTDSRATASKIWQNFTFS